MTTSDLTFADFEWLCKASDNHDMIKAYPDQQYIEMSSGMSYMTSGGTPSVSVGNTVKKFQPLLAGISVDDWFSNQTLIEQESLDTEEEKLVIVMSNTAPASNPDPDVYKEYRKLAIPVGLTVKGF